MTNLAANKKDEFEFLMDMLDQDKETFGDSLIVSDIQRDNNLEFLRPDGKIQLNPFYHSQYYQTWLESQLCQAAKIEMKTKLRLV